MKLVTSALLMTFICCNLGLAGQLISMNPKLLSKAEEPFDVIREFGSPSKYGQREYPTSTADGKAIRLTADGLQKPWLFGSMIEASTSSRFRIASGARMTMVRFSVEQGKLILYKDSPTIEAKPGVAEQIINRFTCNEEGDEIFFDLSNPDFNNLGASYNGNRLTVSDSGGLLYDVQANEKHISWVEKVSLQGNGVTACTIYVRFFFQQYEKSSTYEKRVYTKEDQRKFGYFLTHTQKIDSLQGSYWEALVNRIDINKEIVYYLHPSIPEEYRDACKEGILTWNDVYEAACGVRPIRVELGEEWMLPSDIRYRVIYWFDIAQVGGGAYGPSTKDPLTGEIIDGDVVLFGGAVVANTKKRWAQVSEQLSKVEEEESKEETSAPDTQLTLLYGQGLELKYNNEGSDPHILNTQSMGNIAEGFASEHEFISRFLKGLLCHEIGHTIGLRHNFSASADLKNIVDGQVATSIMDYIDFIKMATPGAYDYAAIAYAHEGAPHLYEGKELIYHTDDEVGTVANCIMSDEGDPVDFQMNRLKGLERYIIKDALKSGKLNLKWYDSSILRYVETLRKFVGADDGKASQRAEAFLLSRVKGEHQLLASINEETSVKEQDLINDLVCFGQYTVASVLFSSKPRALSTWHPESAFPSLSLENQELVARALTDLILNDKAPYGLRKDSVSVLSAQRSSFTYSALKSAKRGLKWKGFKQFVNVFKKTEAQVKHERRQMQMHINRALNSFTD